MSVDRINIAQLPPQSARLLKDAWWAPLIDAERHVAWTRYLEQIHSAIVRIRYDEGIDAGTLGDHLYANGKGRKTMLPRPVALPAIPAPAQRLILEGYPSLEQQDVLGPNSGSRRWGVAEERKRVQAWTAVAVLEQGIVRVPPPVHVTYRFVVPDRGHRDWDNYALICKPVQDGLVKAGILVGDHFAVLTAAVEFVVEKGRRALEIEIRAVGALGVTL